MVKNNKFKLFRNKSSLAKKRSRMLNGGETEQKGNKLGWWERKSFKKNISSDIRITIPELMDKRPDLLAYAIYRNSGLFWLILQYNNIVDIEEEFRAGKEIIVPSRSRTESGLVNNVVKKEGI